jgi:serine/threonine-protein kinase/endoribonuclease IRE1
MLVAFHLSIVLCPLRCRLMLIVFHLSIVPCHSAVLEDAGRYRSYDFASVRDLLRLVRNKRHHFHELPAAAQAVLAPLPGGLLRYVEAAFPALLMHCYAAASEHLQGEAALGEHLIPPSAKQQQAAKALAAQQQQALAAQQLLLEQAATAATAAAAATAATDTSADDGEEAELAPLSTPPPEAAAAAADSSGSSSSDLIENTALQDAVLDTGMSPIGESPAAATESYDAETAQTAVSSDRTATTGTDSKGTAAVESNQTAATAAAADGSEADNSTVLLSTAAAVDTDGSDDTASHTASHLAAVAALSAAPAAAVAAAAAVVAPELHDIVVWSGSAMATGLHCRGWWRDQDHWRRRLDVAKQRQRPAHLTKALADPKYRTRLCSHWDNSKVSVCMIDCLNNFLQV